MSSCQLRMSTGWRFHHQIKSNLLRVEVLRADLELACQELKQTDSEAKEKGFSLLHRFHNALNSREAPWVKCIYFWALPWLKPMSAMPLPIYIYICITDTHFKQVGWSYWLVLYRERFWDVGSFSWLQSSLQQAPHKVFHHLWLILPLANNQSSWTHRSGLLWHSLCNQILRPRHIHHGCRQSITFSLL